MEEGSTSWSSGTGDGDKYGDHNLQPKHKVFLSHSGAQKGFVEQLCVDLERCDRYPFFDKRRDSLPIGERFPRLIFDAIEHCEVGVVVLSEEFFTSKWPMLELVAMANVQKQKPSFKIMPVMLGMTLAQCLDANNHKRWSPLWHTLAESDSRIDLKEWEDALQLFRSINALKYNFELGEVKFREEVINAICALVPPRTQFEVSHIQGRSRLCQVIHKSIEKSQMSSLHEVHVVGLYGVGGIGKTTICKAMCNDLSEEYRNKVAYVELGSRSEEEVLREVLRKLTDKKLDLLGAMDVDQYRHHLMRDIMNVKVFLTIDNVSSTTTSQALTLLRAKYALGSVVLVTARSLLELTALRIDASECMEMPELEMEEARSLFLYHASCVPSTYVSSEDDLKLISSCVKRCYFQKGDDTSYHYHPLSLQVLGEQLGCMGYVPERWWLVLREIDFLNPSRVRRHPVFSILRRSFDALLPEDQLLFMDAALFSPSRKSSSWKGAFKWNVFEWLAMVHGIPVTIVKERLENLKRKSLLENLGDGFGRIGMHDLWREFARLETKGVEFEKRRWTFEWDEYNAHGEASWTNAGSWVNLGRMLFLNKGFVKLQDVSFACFPNLTILKLSTDESSGSVSDLDLDLRVLKFLRSLELDCMEYIQVKSQTLKGLGSLLKLGFLRWSNLPSKSPCIDEISCLTNLQVLDLRQCGRLPDLSNLVFLQAACFRSNGSVVTLTGLSSKHTNLKFLDLSSCRNLRDCPGVGELVALQELCLDYCNELGEVPNLQKLKRLRELSLRACWSLKGLPGLGDLVSLVELRASWCQNLAELPDMRNLQNLRLLFLVNCERLKSLPGLNALVCLQTLKTTGCKNLTRLPDVSELTNLQTLELDPCARLQSFAGLGDLISLRSLDVGIGEVDGLDLHKLTMLETLHISGWHGLGFSSMSDLVSLESVTVDNCKGLRALPDLERLSRLRQLKFQRCEFEDLRGLMNVTSLVDLEIMDCDKLEALPDLRDLAALIELRVERCASLRDIRGILGLRSLELLSVCGHPWLHENLGCQNLHQLTGLRSLDVSDCGFTDLQGLSGCSQLSSLSCTGCPIQELPDLANFPALYSLDVRSCANLTKLICTGPVSPQLSYLNAHGCKRLQALPDLTNARKIKALAVSHSGVVLSAELIQDMKARWPAIRLVTQDTPSQGPLQGSSCGIL